MGGIGRAILAVALLVAVPMPVAADWLQYGGDAARTGQADGPGPSWNDVAYHISLSPYHGTILSWPVVVEGFAYFIANATTSNLLDPESLPLPVANQLYRLEIQTGKLVRLKDYTVPLYYLAAGDGVLYASGHNALHVLDMDGTLLDSETLRLGPSEVPNDYRYAATPDCGAPVVAADMVVLGCNESRGYYRLTMAQAFRAGTLEPLWDSPFVARSAMPPESCGTEVPAAPLEVFNCHYAAAIGYQNPFAFIGYNAPQLSVIGTNVYVVVRSIADAGSSPSGAAPAYGGFSVYAVNSADGTADILDHDWNMNDPANTGPVPALPAPVTGDNEHVFVRSGHLRRYDAAEPAFYQWDRSQDIWTRDRITWDAGVALAGGHVYATSADTLYRFDRELEPDIVFRPFSLPAGEKWASGPLIAAGPIIVARAHRSDTSQEGPSSILYAVDANSGELVWRHAFPWQAHVALSDGVIVAIQQEDQQVGGDELLVSVLGTTAASLQLDLGHLGRYPGVGEQVDVDLSSTRNGAFGPATQFRASWGDGSETPWQADPVMHHTYPLPGDQVARFEVRNEANQTSSFPVTFFVGRVNPADNFFNSWYKPSYENTRFFFLGLIVTGLAGLFGILHTGHRRRRMHRELGALERDFERLKDDSGACDRMLNDRRTHVRSLFLRRNLEEAHVAFLTQRMHELRQGLRLSQVEQRFDFLPQGMVKTLREMLKDAHITEWERTHFLEALGRDNSLTPGQKRQVRHLIESWFSRDTGA